MSDPVNPCLAKRIEGEPVFVLLGRDPHAPMLIEAWANARIALGGKEEQKGLDARMTSLEFSTFKEQHPDLGLPVGVLSAAQKAILAHAPDIKWARDDEGFVQESGEPGIGKFADALQMWAWRQPTQATVAEAATAFRCSVKSICQAIDNHIWMYLDGERDDPAALIGHDGE